MDANERAKKWYQENTERRKIYRKALYQQQKEDAVRKQGEGKKFIREYLETHWCVDCGETDPDVLEFDHIQAKKNNVTSLTMASNSRIMEEIMRCQVVCANCHRRRTKRRRAEAA